MASSAAGAQNRCVFVGNIPYDATEDQLIQICEDVGPVVSFRLVLDKETGKPKGYGFCEYKDEETALSARRNLQGYEINGRQLRVDFAENGKNADRNREQGRGGPGMASSTDARKQSGGPSILGDSSLHQPIGLQLAATAASLMAGALGGAQTASIPNGLLIQPGPGNDRLTQYLARMSRHQLNEIMSELKTLTTQNKALARQLLQGISQLPKALFQAQILLGMVPPQMMQMAKIPQQCSSFSQPPFQIKQTLSHSESAITSRPLEAQMANLSQNPTILLDSVLRLQHVPQYQQPLQPQAKVLPEAVMFPLRQSQSVGGLPSIQPTLSLSTTRIPMAILQQHSNHSGAPNLVHQPPLVPPNASLQQPLLPCPPLPQIGLSNGPLLPIGSETLAKEVKASTHPGLDSSYSSIISTQIADQEVMTAHMSELHRPSKLRRLENAAIASRMTDDSAIANAVQQTEKQVPQLSPDIESALLQQVLNLTPEQLSSLPVEQQQEVLQLQKMISASK